jgi:putative addiction module component (TIGR02574 family)
MSATVKSLGIDRLSREERLALVQEIWDTIAAEQPPPLPTEAQRQELARRVMEDDTTPENVVPWEQVKAQALARLRQP